MNTIKNSKIFWRITGVLNTLSIITLFLFIGIQVSAFGMWFYTWQFDVNNTYEVVNMEPEHLHQVVRHTIDYMQLELDRDTGLQIETVVGGETRNFFSDLEIRHMVDVYDLFEGGFALQNVIIGIFVASSLFFIIFGRDKLKILFQSWKYITTGLVALLAVLSVIIATNWIRAWHIFHYIFFDNDYWLLDPRVDLLVNIVPYDFFAAIALFVATVFGGGMVLIFAISTFMLRKNGRFSRQ